MKKTQRKSNARIVTARVNRDVILTRTTGSRRSDIDAVAVTRENGAGSRTHVLVQAADKNGECHKLHLNGRQSRTLYNVLRKHYANDEQPSQQTRLREMLENVSAAHEIGVRAGASEVIDLIARLANVDASTLREAVVAAIKLGL